MYIHKIGEDEVIFDSEEQYKLVTCLGGRKLNQRKIWIDKSNTTTKYYAMLSYMGKNIRVHHIIAGHPINGHLVDHFNGNSLDNRTCNLRVVTRSINGYNKASKTNMRWITPQKNGRFQVCFRIGLGTYPTLEKAQERVRKFLEENNIEIYKDFYEGTSDKE